MQDLILYIVLILLCVVVYLLLDQKKNKDEGKNNEELERLKDPEQVEKVIKEDIDKIKILNK